MTPEPTTPTRDCSVPDAADRRTEPSEESPHLRVDCFVRASALADSVYETIDRLETLTETDRIDDLDLTAWPEAVAMTDAMAGTDVRETFDRFQAWADQWNVDIRPPFDVQDRTSQLGGRDGEVLVTPMVCLAVYAEGALVGVFPHVSDGEVCRVEDAIDAIESGEVAPNGAERSALAPVDRPAEREACPVCGSRLVNGQGLYHCRECNRPVVATESGQYATPGHERGGGRARPLRERGPGLGL